MRLFAQYALLLLCCLPLAHAESTLLLQPKASEAQTTSADAQNGQAEQLALLREKQTNLTKLLQRLESPNGLSAGAPTDATPAELEERRLRVAFSISLLDRHITDLGRLSKVRTEREQLNKAIATWSGFTETPPYPIRLVDRLRADRDDAQKSLDTLLAREALLKGFNERTTREVKDSESHIRKLAENAERRADSTSGLHAWAAELSQLQLQTAQISAAMLQTIRDLQDAEIGVAQEQLKFNRRKLDIALENFSFSAEEFAKINSELDSDSMSLERQRQALSRKLVQHRAAFEQAQETLEIARSRAIDTNPAMRELNLANSRIDSDNYMSELLRGTADAQRLNRLLWAARYQAMHRDQAGDRVNASNTVESVRSFTSMWRQGLEQQRSLLDMRLQRLDVLIAESSEAEDHKHLTALRRLAEEVLPAQRSAFTQLEGMERLLRLTNEELGTARKELSTTEQLGEWKIHLERWAQSAWDYELMAVEDAIEVDGKQITGKRSITIGKVLAALLAFIAGIATCLLLARLICSLLVKRFKWSESNARILRRWLLTVEFVLLGIIVLAWARIPLTVFAFFGGAIAIGAGFAMQTLLKNLMSGVMILGERPFRPGDFVEIDGITGTVMDIGIRASTIRDINGIETIVPNASFIEQNLTNWTYSSSRVRFTVRVGVAYGAPIKRVIELLESAAQRHGLILRDPAPEVVFEDFGNDAQVFALSYWLEMGPNVTARIVASDIRRMIEHSFTENGIIIAFPQRDVHLDITQPVQVKFVDPQ